MKIALIAASITLSIPALAQNTPENVKNFALPQPSSTANLEKLSLWATWYFLPQMSASQASGEQLFAIGNKPLDIKLAHCDWSIW